MLSSRNAYGRFLSSFRNADTGVRKSAITDLYTGMTFPCDRSVLTSSKLGCIKSRVSLSFTFLASPARFQLLRDLSKGEASLNQQNEYVIDQIAGFGDK